MRHRVSCPSPRLTWLTLLCSAVILLVSGTALAGGRIQFDKTVLEENKAGTQSSWKVELKVFLDKAPDLATIPVKFEFKPTVYYERFIEDGDKEPKTRKVPLQGRQSLFESADLGFLDPGTGKIENRTRFSFRITRGHGFEAGEYQVTIRDGRSGNPIGQTTRLVLQGENELIDRRAMVFAGKSDEEQKKQKEAEEKKKAESEAALAQNDDPLASSEDESGWAEDTSEQMPMREKKKPGGCGCRVESETATLSSGLGIAGLLLLAGLRRRRRAA
jgi:MYXO-CTERM domain-containing protein